jgi:hypothetical protein
VIVRGAVVAAALAIAGCGQGESDADRAALRRVERNIELGLRQLRFEQGPPRRIRATCHKDGDRAFTCAYGYDDRIGGQCLRYTATAHGTIRDGRYRLDTAVGPTGNAMSGSVEGSLDRC